MMIFNIPLAITFMLHSGMASLQDVLCFQKVYSEEVFFYVSDSNKR